MGRRPDTPRRARRSPCSRTTPARSCLRPSWRMPPRCAPCTRCCRRSESTTTKAFAACLGPRSRPSFRRWRGACCPTARARPAPSTRSSIARWWAARAECSVPAAPPRAGRAWRRRCAASARWRRPPRGFLGQSGRRQSCKACSPCCCRTRRRRRSEPSISQRTPSACRARCFEPSRCLRRPSRRSTAPLSRRSQTCSRRRSCICPTCIASSARDSTRPWPRCCRRCLLPRAIVTPPLRPPS
mmetsp:Transcript_12424/g.52241  ORF Transcript_12424/g.52241 Transcript_12424/m.52241 type:complete len:242 (+) Transcript_12424:272-997(+)